MTKEQVNRVLTGMVGKLYKYQGTNHRVLRFSNETVLRIVTDKKDLTFMHDDFDPKDFEELAEAVADPVLPDKVADSYRDRPTVPMLMNSNSLITNKGIDIANILMENIDKVRSDKNYVAQASAINDTVKQFIELAKTEVALINATR